MNPTPDLLSKVVKIWHHHMPADAEPTFVGKVVGFYDHPSITIEDAGGHQSTHSSQLRIEIKDLPPEPEVGGAASLTVKPTSSSSSVTTVWVRHKRGWFYPTLLQRDPEFYTWEQLNLRGEVRPLVADRAALPFTGPLRHTDPDGDILEIKRTWPGRADVVINNVESVRLTRGHARLAGEALLAIAAEPEPTDAAVS